VGEVPGVVARHRELRASLGRRSTEVVTEEGRMRRKVMADWDRRSSKYTGGCDQHDEVMIQESKNSSVYSVETDLQSETVHSTRKKRKDEQRHAKQRDTNRMERHWRAKERLRISGPKALILPSPGVAYTQGCACAQCVVRGR
jgi:hypothetical protein